MPDIYVFRCTRNPQVSPDDPKRGEIEAQWTALAGFFERWFKTPSGEFVAGFQAYDTPDDFAEQIEACLREWLGKRGLSPTRQAEETSPKREDLLKREDLRRKQSEEAWASREDALKREAELKRRETERARHVERLKRAGFLAAVMLAVAAGGIAAYAYRQRQITWPPRDLLAAAFALIDAAMIGVLIVWRTARPALLWALVTLCIPLSAALIVDAMRGHAMRVILPHETPIAAMTVSDDENLLAVADQNGFVGVARTDSENLNLSPTSGSGRAAYFVSQDANGAALKSPHLVLVDNAGDFKVCEFVSDRFNSIGPCRMAQLQLQPAQQQIQQQDQSGSEGISEWTYVSSAMNKDGVVAAVRAGSRRDPDVDDTYEIYFSNRGMPPLALPVRPTAIAPYEGAVSGTAMSDAASQPFLLGFENGTIGIQWHDTSHVPHLAMSAVRAKGSGTRPIVKLASSPGNRMATADSEGAIVGWRLDQESGVPVMHEEFRLRSGTINLATREPVFSAQFSPDRSRIVTTSREDLTTRVWDAETGAPVGEPLMGHDDVVTSAAFSSDGKRIVTASADKTARIWDTATGKPIVVLQAHDGVVTSAAFSPDGKRIVTASADKTARIWDTATGKPIVVLQAHDDVATSAAFSPDGSRIVTASADKTARIWDAGTGKPVGEPLMGHDGVVTSAAFSPDGKRIVTTSADKTARIWDTGTGKPVGEPLMGHDGVVTSAAFSPDGKRIVTASADKTARFWDTATGKPVGEPLMGHDGVVTSAAFSPDGSRIVTVSADGTARVWDAATGTEIQQSASSPRCQGCVFIGIDEVNEALETVDGFGRQAQFGLNSGQQLNSNSFAQPQAEMLFVDSKSHSVLDLDDDGSVNSTALGDLPAHSALISHTIFLKDGRVVTGAIDGSVRIINPTISAGINLLDLGQESLQSYLRFAALTRELAKQKKAISGTLTSKDQDLPVREFLMKRAIEYNLAGSAENRPNRIVRFTFHGETERVDAAIAAVRERTRTWDFTTSTADIDTKLNAFTILAWTSTEANITNPYDLAFRLRLKDEKISKAEANDVWDAILRSTLKGDDLKKLDALD